MQLVHTTLPALLCTVVSTVHCCRHEDSVDAELKGKEKMIIEFVYAVSTSKKQDNWWLGRLTQPFAWDWPPQKRRVVVEGNGVKDGWRGDTKTKRMTLTYLSLPCS